MTRAAGLGRGLSATIASRLAPGRHDASCTLVMKLNSATRLSLPAAQPKPTRASLLTQVCGTAVRWPLARDTCSSCTARAPFAVLSLKPTWTTSRLPSGLKAALATELAAGSPADVCAPVVRFSTCRRQRAAHGGVQAIWVALAAITPSKVRLARGAAGSHSLSAVARPISDRRQPQASGPGRDIARDSVGFRCYPRVA